jgi:hypothetical protein
MLPLTEDRWIRALEIRPSNRAVTHHSMIFSADVAGAMSAMAGGGPRIASGGLFNVLGVWAVGTPATVYPEGMGRWVRQGQMLRTNLHYQTTRARINTIPIRPRPSRSAKRRPTR